MLQYIMAVISLTSLGFRFLNKRIFASPKILETDLFQDIGVDSTHLFMFWNSQCFGGFSHSLSCWPNDLVGDRIRTERSEREFLTIKSYT